MADAQVGLVRYVPLEPPRMRGNGSAWNGGKQLCSLRLVQISFYLIALYIIRFT